MTALTRLRTPRFQFDLSLIARAFPRTFHHGSDSAPVLHPYRDDFLGCGHVLDRRRSWREPRAESDLPQQASRILGRYCHRCHRGAGSAAGYEFDVRDVASLLEGTVVKAGSPNEFPLWNLMHRGTMPPKSQAQLPRPTPAEAEIVAQWIKAGAARFPSATPRDPLPLTSTFQAIHDDLRKLPDARTRKRQRYFTLVELHNNPAVADETIVSARAGLAKALNSLSWERELVIPRAVALPPRERDSRERDSRERDPRERSTDASSVRESKGSGTASTDEASVLLPPLVFAVDIESLGWSRDHWRAIRTKYPYALGFGNLDDTKLRDLDADILQLTENAEPLSAIRADWFQAIATQPPLYHSILFDLSLPELRQRPTDPTRPANPKRMTALDLERHLGINVAQTLLEANERLVARAGFTPSGVSGQNRLVERHVTKYGAYWKSYDFKGNNRRAILSQFPLGPALPNHPFPALAFEHDGGEIVFHLPNGLQGYLLIDGRDNRVDAGPIEVVSDALKTSGTPAIVSGLSCIAWMSPTHSRWIRTRRGSRSSGPDSSSRKAAPVCCAAGCTRFTRRRTSRTSFRS